MTSASWTKDLSPPQPTPPTRRAVRWLLPALLLWLCVGTLACRQNAKEGESCFATYECTPGLFCAGGTCIVPSGQQGCKTIADCPTNFRCRFFVCVDTNTLRPCTVSQAAQQCTRDQICKDGFCAIPGEGDRCDTQPCRLGLVCNTQTNPPICRIGRICETTDDCDDGFLCERNRCVRESVTTECSTTDDCAEGEFCNDDGQCEVP